MWRGDHVAVKQLIDAFARYLYLPRLNESAVLSKAIRNGLALLTWEQESFAYADSFDEAAQRYRGLRCGQHVSITEEDSGLIVRPAVALKQAEAERRGSPGATGSTTVYSEPASPDIQTVKDGGNKTVTSRPASGPKRFHGSVVLDTTRVGRDAGRIADEVIAHLAGLVGSRVKVTLEIEAEIPTGAPENVVRIVTENSRTLKFVSQGFEKE